MKFFNNSKPEVKEEFLSVAEAKERLQTEVAEAIQFKLLKNGTMKKKVGKIVFEILFFSSSWNASYESVRVNAELRIHHRQYDRIGYMSISTEDDYWFDISTVDKLESVAKTMIDILLESAVALANRFEQNYNEAVQYLLNDGFEKYHVELDYIADELGIDAIRDRAKQIYDELNDVIKEQVAQYKLGSRDCDWMINRCNLRYIVDQGLV